MGDLVRLRREYSAKPVQFRTDEGYTVRMAGTVEGSIDFCIATAQGSLTYALTPGDARLVQAGLHAVCGDIRDNCMFDRDPRLYDTKAT